MASEVAAAAGIAESEVIASIRTPRPGRRSPGNAPCWDAPRLAQTSTPRVERGDMRSRRSRMSRGSNTGTGGGNSFAANRGASSTVLRSQETGGQDVCSYRSG